ncbi:MAG TPA: glycosyltransferase family 2 protein [Fimbriimonadaceae bacterium]|nr:glycosyltransferase family 2 protein [Fimbriimonadaceae bacterium]
MELSVTICSWNTLQDLRICLASLEAVRDDAAFEVLVIDNNSADGSPDMVEAEFPWVRLYRMSKNLGFTGGQNYALKERSAPHALLLNSDTVVHPGAFSRIMEFYRANPAVGVIGPRLLNSDGSLQYSCRRFPNPVAALFRNTPIGKLFPKNRFTRDYLMTDWGHDNPREVDWVSGAALFASKPLIDRIGLLDEEYFMFCEDVDWCWRAWDAGFKVMYLPDSVITHAIGRSTDKAPNRMIGRFHKSMFRFYRKNMVPKMFILWRPFALAFAGLALLLRAGMFILKNKIDILRRRFAS